MDTYKLPQELSHAIFTEQEADGQKRKKNGGGGAGGERGDNSSGGTGGGGEGNGTGD